MAIDPDILEHFKPLEKQVADLDRRVLVLEKKDFKLFDDLLFTGKPDDLGLTNLDFLPANRYSFPNGRENPPDRTHTTGLGVEMRGIPAVHDLELWHGDPNEVAWHIQVSEDFNAGYGEGITGHYAKLPSTNYWAAIREEGHPNLAPWRAENERWLSLFPHVTAQFPSLYTFYEDQDQHELYIRGSVTEARRLAALAGVDLPVYPYVTPYFHNSSEFSGQLVPGDYWRRQMTVLQEVADGIVFWGGWGRDWDETQEWWVETKSVFFLEPL